MTTDPTNIPSAMAVAVQQSPDPLTVLAQLGAARREIDRLKQDAEAESHGAMLYITALVAKSGGIVEFTADELRAANQLILERAETEDNGLILRCYMAPVVATPRPIILPESAIGVAAIGVAANGQGPEAA